MLYIKFFSQFFRMQPHISACNIRGENDVLAMLRQKGKIEGERERRCAGVSICINKERVCSHALGAVCMLKQTMS